MSSKWILESCNFDEIIDYDNAQQSFLNEYKDYLSKSRQCISTKLKANQQKIMNNKQKDQQLELKILNQKEMVEKMKLDVQIVHKENELAIGNKNQLEERIEEMRKENMELKLKLDEITREIQEKNKDMKHEWNAIVKACNIYKKYLDIHIKMEKFQDVVQIQVTFFISENPQKDNYYVLLGQLNKKWKVQKIVPKLKQEDQSSVDVLPKEMENLHVTILLWKLRSIFLNYKRS